MTDGADEHEFDIVLWGATGFTGRLVAEYFAQHPDIADVDWAIAGRNENKLRDVRSGLAAQFSDLPILLGDSLDRDSLDDIASRTRVVCTTVGPYARYGSDLVAACVKNGTDYCDLTGEVQWIRKMIDTHHDEAARKGVRIVHCCGFDAIPSDLGTYLVQDSAIRRYGKPCDEVRCLVWKIRGGFSGGTAASTAEVLKQASEDRDIRRILADPYALNPKGERSGPDESFQRGPRREKALESWSGPFIMAAINERIVRRSNALLEYRYGSSFRYSEAFHVGKGIPAAFRATLMSAGIGAFAAALSLKPTRKLVERFVLPSSGEGPDAETIENGCFTLRFFGRGTDDGGQSFDITARVESDLDPGYDATSKMLGESALCLAFDEVKRGVNGGVLTPASAMGDALLKRLRQTGMTFELE